MKKLFLLVVCSWVLIFSCSDKTNNKEDEDIVSDEDQMTTESDRINDEDTIKTSFCPPWHKDCTDVEEWKSVSSKKQQQGVFRIVWLEGSAYEMGKQHGKLLKDEIEWAMKNSTYIDQIKGLLPTIKSMGYVDFAEKNSYKDIVDECKGMVEETEDVGWTMDLCLVINFGDVLMEMANNQQGGVISKSVQLTPGCSQIIANKEASEDRHLYHARILDWAEVDVLVKYPTIFVRQPSDGIPHAYIGFPGNLSPYSGINAAGITAGSNEAHPLNSTHTGTSGHSHVQMLGQILKRAHSFDEAETLIENEQHMSTEVIVVGDGVRDEGVIFELTAKVVDKRPLKEGVAYVTNHFEGDISQYVDKEPVNSSSQLRFDRLKQLLTPRESDSLYGVLNPITLVEIMRDTTDPYTGEKSALDEFNNGESLATNGAVFQIVFDAKNLLFWVAAGETPIPGQPFMGFSLSKLLEMDTTVDIVPEKID